MPLDFRTVDEDEGFSMKRFLRTMGLGIAVFLVFLALGYYVVGPRLTFTPEGIPRIRWRLDTPSTATSNQPPPLPKVEVYEKLPTEVVAATGAEAGPREVAPFDYEQYLKRRARTRPPRQPAVSETPMDQEIPLDDEPLIVPDESETAPADVPADTPEPPPSPEPSPEPQPEPPSPPTRPDSGVPLYRVQVGVYTQRENANAIAQALLSNGFEVSIVPFQVKGRPRYRVQVLVTRDRAKAEQVKQRLESKGFTSYIAEIR